MMGDHLTCEERHEWKWLAYSVTEEEHACPSGCFFLSEYSSGHECAAWTKFSSDVMFNESFVVFVRAKRGEHKPDRYFAPYELGWFTSADQEEAAAWLEAHLNAKLKRSAGKGKQITITISEEHEAVLMAHEPDGDYLPEEVTTLEQRLACLVDGYCRSILIEEAEDDMQFYKRMMHLRGYDSTSPSS